MTDETSISRGEVWLVDLEPIKGSEMGKRRPCLVISNDVANRYSPVVTVVAITSVHPSKNYPFMVEIPEQAGMPKRSWVTCAHIRTVSKDRLERLFVNLDETTMMKVNEAIGIQLGLR